MKYRYSIENSENLACAYVKNENASFKQSTMISKMIRGKNVDEAISRLEKVTTLVKAVPFTRYNTHVAHKVGIAGGRYPVKASQAFIKLLKSAKNNAKVKNLGEDLTITHICAKKGASIKRYGRHRGRATKVVHLEVALMPVKKDDKK